MTSSTRRHHRLSTRQTRILTTGLTISVYSCLLGFHQAETSSSRVLGLVVALVAVVVAMSQVSGYAWSVANTTAFTFTAWFFWDVMTGPTPEFVLLVPMFYGPMAWAIAHLVALPFHVPGDHPREVIDAETSDRRDLPQTVDEQVRAWRAYRNEVIGTE